MGKYCIHYLGGKPKRDERAKLLLEVQAVNIMYERFRRSGCENFDRL